MSENWKIQVSPKLPDGTLVNIRAESGAELTTLLNYATENAQLIVDTAALLAAARNASAVTQPQAQPAAQANGFAGGGNTQPAQQQAQPAAQPAGGGGQSCEHGTYVWKDFVSKAGNPIKGYFCPANFRTTCKADFRK